MAGNEDDFPLEARDAIRHYEERLLEFAAASATYAHADPETALWNGRRVAEAACLIVLCVVKRRNIENVRGKIEKPRGLDDLLKDLEAEKLMVDPQRTLFENLQRSVNIGVHVRYQGREMAGDLTDQAHEQLRKVLKWLYERSVAGPYLERADRMHEIDERLKRATSHQPSPHQLLENLENLYRNLTHEKGGLVQRAEQAERRADEATKRASDLEAALERTVRRDTEAESDRPATARTSPYLLVLAVLLGFGGGVLMVGGAWMLTPASPASSPMAAVAPQPASPQPPTPDAPPSPDRASPLAQGARDPDPAQGAAVAATCPDGFVLIPPTLVRLAQPRPERKGWPAASPARIAPIQHPAVCLAEAPEPIDSASEEARRDCASSNSSAAGCTTRQEAIDTCAARGHRLPGLVDWEAAARAKVQVRRGHDNEWIRDDFPPAVLNRRGKANNDAMFRGKRIDREQVGEEDVWWSWNQADGENRFAQVGFRCATDPGP